MILRIIDAVLDNFLLKKKIQKLSLIVFLEMEIYEFT